MPPNSGGTEKAQQQQAPGPAQGSESIGAGQSILQSIAAGGYLRGGASDPRVQLATMDSQKDELGKQLALAQQRYDENMSALGTNPQARGNADAHFAEMSALRQRIADLDASKSTLMESAGITQQGVDIAKQFGQRLQTGLETGNFVDPAEMEAMRTAASGLSQDVATTRGLNRSDVPVMQSIAPTLASMWLGQQNTNKAFYTGAYSANQGLGLQANQNLMSINNPGLGLASVYSGVRGSNVTGGQQRTEGLVGYLGAGGQAAQGVGTAAIAAKSLYATCWIAEALYGVDAQETHTLRRWLNTEFIKTWHGRMVMAAYAAWGRQVAAGVRKYWWLRRIMKPLFDAALAKARRHYGA